MNEKHRYIPDAKAKLTTADKLKIGQMAIIFLAPDGSRPFPAIAREIKETKQPKNKRVKVQTPYGDVYVGGGTTAWQHNIYEFESLRFAMMVFADHYCPKIVTQKSDPHF